MSDRSSSSEGSPAPWEVAGGVDRDCFTVDSSEVTSCRVLFSPIASFPPGKVGEFSSVMDISSIQNIARKCSFPSDLELMVPHPDDRACFPPEGFFTVYKDCLECGLRFPLHPVLAALQGRFGISLGQISPNSFRHLICLGVESFRRGIPFTLDLVLRFLQFKNSGGWFYLSPRLTFRAKTKSKHSDWQKKFFFCRYDEVPSFMWRTKKVKQVSVAEQSEVESVLCSLAEVTEIYSEVVLAEAGFSPFDPTAAVGGASGVRFFTSYSFSSFCCYLLFLLCCSGSLQFQQGQEKVCWLYFGSPK